MRVRAIPTYRVYQLYDNNIILRINRLLETVWTLARLVHCMNTQNVHTMCNFAHGQFHKYGNCMGICGGQSRKLLPTTTFLAVRGWGDKTGPNTEDRLVCIGNLSMCVLLYCSWTSLSLSAVTRALRSKSYAAERHGMGFNSEYKEDGHSHMWNYAPL